jgi:hypothetical protein
MAFAASLKRTSRFVILSEAKDLRNFPHQENAQVFRFAQDDTYT